MSRLYSRTMLYLFGAMCLLIAANAEFVWAQSATDSDCIYHIFGTISDIDTKKALPFAHIHLNDGQYIAISDSLGNYSIANLCIGTYVAVCSHLGCEPIEQVVTLSNNDIQLNFILPHHQYELAVATVKSSKYKVLATQSETTLSNQELLGKRGESLGEALQQISGVSTLQSGSNVIKPVINGLHSQRIVILNNGVRQEGQQWGQDHAPEIDPFVADKLTVIKGANGVRYGADAIAGIILVEPKPLRYEKGIGGELNLATFSNGRTGVLSGRIDANFGFLPRFAWRLQGTLKRGGNVHTPDYYLKNTGISEYNFSYIGGYKNETYSSDIFYSQYNADIGIFAGSHIGNLSDLQTAINSPSPLVTADFSYAISRPRQRAEHELLKWSNRLKINNIGSVSLDLARQFNRRQEYDARRPYNDSLAQLDPPQLNFILKTYTADFTFEHRPIKKWAGSVGVSGMLQQNTYSGIYFIPKYEAYNGGIWAIERHKWQHYEVELGIRYDVRQLNVSQPNPTHVAHSFLWHNISASIGGVYRPNDRWRVSFNSGIAWRPPHVSELFSNGVHHGAASFEIGNPSLQTERAYNTIAAIQYRNKQLTADLNLFANLIDNYIYVQPTLPPTLTIRGAFPTFLYTQTNALLIGIDWSVVIPLSQHLSWLSKASLLQTNDLTIGGGIPLMPPVRFDSGLQYQFKNNKSLTESYAKITVLHVLKSAINDTLDYAPPPNAYLLLNANAGTTLHIGKQAITLTLAVQNLLNTSYRDYMNRQRYFADEIGRNISIKINYLLLQ